MAAPLYISPMLSVGAHGDVTRLLLRSAAGRLVGYDVSTYVVRGVMVDTGFHGARRHLARWLDANPLRGVAVTHEHEDHAGNVELLARRGVPILAAPATLAAVRDVGPIGLYRRVVWRAMPSLATEIAPFSDDALRLVPTPGHSRDHHAVWDDATRTLFAGDLFLGVKVRIAHPHENPRLTAASARAAARLGPRRMFCAHRGPVADPVGALTAKADWMDDLIRRVDDRIGGGWSDAAILEELLGGESVSGRISFGDYSRGNFVRMLRATRGDPVRAA